MPRQRHMAVWGVLAHTLHAAPARRCRSHSQSRNMAPDPLGSTCTHVTDTGSPTHSLDFRHTKTPTQLSHMPPHSPPGPHGHTLSELTQGPLAPPVIPSAPRFHLAGLGETRVKPPRTPAPATLGLRAPKPWPRSFPKATLGRLPREIRGRLTGGKGEGMRPPRGAGRARAGDAMPCRAGPRLFRRLFRPPSGF